MSRPLLPTFRNDGGLLSESEEEYFSVIKTDSSNEIRSEIWENLPQKARSILETHGYYSSSNPPILIIE